MFDLDKILPTLIHNLEIFNDQKEITRMPKMAQFCELIHINLNLSEDFRKKIF